MTTNSDHRKALQRAAGQALGFKIAFDARHSVSVKVPPEARRRACNEAVERALEVAAVKHLYSTTCSDEFLAGMLSVRERFGSSPETPMSTRVRPNKPTPAYFNLDNWLKALRAFMNTKRVSPGQIARDTGLSLPIVVRILRGELKPSQRHIGVLTAYCENRS